MSYFNQFELRPLKNRENEFELVLFLDDLSTEFANELGEKPETRSNLLESAKTLVAEKYPGIKVTMVRVMVCGVIFASYPISTIMTSAQTENNNEDNVQIEDGSTYYGVLPGDTLWKLSQRFQTSVSLIKEANKLESDTLQLNQKLIIPKALHTVVSGESLSTIARDYTTTISAISEANQLNSDMIQINQILIIPQIINHSTEGIVNEASPSTYKVQEGDTLSEIAKQHNLSIKFLMVNNGLVNESIQVDQILRLKEDFKKGKKNEIGTVKMLRSNELYVKKEDGTLNYVKTLPKGGAYRVYSIDYENGLYHVGGKNWVKISSDSQFTRVGEKPNTNNGVSYLTHTVAPGETIWGISVKYGIPQYELLKVNKLKLDSYLSVGQKLKVPQYQIAVKETASSKHGEYLDWWTEAQYVVPIGKTFKVRDLATGKSFMVQRTIGANHADSETLTTKDSNIAKGIWKGYSWKERAVIIEVDGRKIAASMSFMPHEREYIKDNGITGHFDIHFKNSTRHKDGKIDFDHQKQVNIAAGVKAK